MDTLLKFLNAPVLVSLFALVGAILAGRHQNNKRKAGIDDATSPATVAFITGGAMAERSTAEAQNEALNRLADAMEKMAQAGGDPATNQVHRARQLELLEEAHKLRRAVEEGVAAIKELARRDSERGQ